jgi:hypothetical protein
MPPTIHHRREVILSGALELKLTGVPGSGSVDLSQVISLLNQLLGKETTMAASIQDAIARIESLKSVEAGVAATVDTVVSKIEELRALIASGADAQPILDAVDALSADLSSQKDRLAAAVVANTP